jgi:hypothetical protein
MFDTRTMVHGEITANLERHAGVEPRDVEGAAVREVGVHLPPVDCVRFA